jgi:N-formylglutamate deformylase
MTDWLEIRRGDAPLLLCFPHTGTLIPGEEELGLISPWSARQDGDWWIDRLYDFAGDLGVTTIRTAISRTMIDVNRDPSGASLYPGQATTELCPTTCFDGEPLYRQVGPDPHEIDRRRKRWFAPYHDAIEEELRRLRELHPHVVLYDAHAIRSDIPRLFQGLLPQFNIGTNGGTTCHPALTERVREHCAASGHSHVVDGRFKGGWTTRRYGQPEQGIHAIQMELSCRGYMEEPDGASTPENWPTPYDSVRAAPMRAILSDILKACIAFAREQREVAP